MKKVLPLTIAAALALGGCTTTNTGPREEFVGGKCNAEPAQTFVGQRATVATGGAIQKLTGAAILRWIPPRSAVTMDFREERVSISYNDDQVIEIISCG